MIGWLAAVALATAPAVDFEVWSPEQSVAFEQAIYLVSSGTTCPELEVVDSDGAAVTALCDTVGQATDGAVLRLQPDPAWPAGAIEIRPFGAAEGVQLAVVSGALKAATVAIPIDRTVTAQGVSYRVCHDGELVLAIRSETAPVGLDGTALVLGPDELVAWFGSTNGGWSEAAPGARATFWFTAVDATGELAPWLADEVELVGEDIVRTDLRFGYDLELGLCPDADSEWVLGEELDAGSPGVGTLPRNSDDKKGGCGSGGGALLLLPLLMFGRRRPYHSSCSA